MRNATVLVINLKGLATETIKNIVLAGIGKLVVLDGENVTEEDLGAGFFFRDADVGTNRAVAAKPRIESLNPLVVIETITTHDKLKTENMDELINGVDLVCVTDLGRDVVVPVNDACARLGKKFYCAATFGMLGYIFCDLGRHEYLAKDRKDNTKMVMHAVQYSRMMEALQHSWKGLKRRDTKELNPAVVFTVMAILEWQAAHGGQLPDDAAAADELESIANGLLMERGVNTEIINKVPRERAETMAVTAAHEFSPVCAIVGGFVGQDILKVLQGKEAPFANFFTFDGLIGGATVCPLDMQ